eukprot:Phypoly_transcript_03819.p1 GENE.Phypoly_transcript_03819~~Phypoly_transcript_03819.p1  ORF type:complete len:654 (+),score=64.41 Phypoly_transcript_03819:47-2008(+)
MLEKHVVSLVHQGTLLAKLKDIFPQEHIHENFTKHPQLLRSPGTGVGAELDIWIPSLNLAFEFQDSYHFTTAWYYNKPTDAIALRDNSKQTTARSQNIRLVVIPCWWQGDTESLEATIEFYNPELLGKRISTPLIPLNPPSFHFSGDQIPGVGELMLVSFLVDSNSTFSARYWWLGEKYDGIRACWHPVHCKLYSRTVKEIAVLPKLCAWFPRIYADGELWFGRGQYNNAYNLIKNSENLVVWDLLRMISFDVPSRRYQHRSFESRYASLLDHSSSDNCFNIVAPRIASKNQKQINRMAHEIIRDGGEGVILRKRGSRYIPGRSHALVKLKTSQCDLEALVVGKNGQSSIFLTTPHGRTFGVLSPDILLPSLPPLGAIVSVSFDNAARRDAPVNAKVYRVRRDVEWEDVVRNAMYNKDLSQIQVNFSSRPVGHWTGKNMRLMLMNVAKSKRMDPLIADTWYQISSNELLKYKGGSAILQKHNGYFNALQHLFPEIKLDKSKFSTSLWKSVTKRRQAFEKYAKENGFDPLVPKHWYTQPSEKIQKIKGIQSILRFHGRSIMRALLELFPTIGLDKSKFKFVQLWREKGNRKKFFTDYAQVCGFEPMDPNNWTPLVVKNLLKVKGIDGVIAYHKRSVAQALLDLFGLDIPRPPSR